MSNKRPAPEADDTRPKQTPITFHQESPHPYGVTCKRRYAVTITPKPAKHPWLVPYLSVELPYGLNADHNLNATVTYDELAQHIKDHKGVADGWWYGARGAQGADVVPTVQEHLCAAQFEAKMDQLLGLVHVERHIPSLASLAIKKLMDHPQMFAVQALNFLCPPKTIATAMVECVINNRMWPDAGSAWSEFERYFTQKTPRVDPLDVPDAVAAEYEKIRTKEAT